MTEMKQYVVVGGGVAGVCCAEELCRLLSPDEATVVLVAATDVVKVTPARHTRAQPPSVASRVHRKPSERATALAMPTQGVENVVRVTDHIEQFDGASGCPAQLAKPSSRKP
jgi:glycine/D-amino acid oxidase-like deaminating enzyme